MQLSKSVIGMVHVGALPGTPENYASVKEIVRQSTKEAMILKREGIDAVMIENMHDRPYLNRLPGPEIVAMMTAVAIEVRRNLDIPTGIQILAGANKEALAVALAAELDFIRAEGFIFGHLADEGWMNSDAGELLRFRKQIGAGHIKIYTDIKKKHSSHFATSDVSIAEFAKTAEFFLSDGLIVTGMATGEEASVEEIMQVKNATCLPVIIGSGIDTNNIHKYWNLADAFIVGSSFKEEGNWENEVSPIRVRKFMQKVTELRQ